MQDRRNLVFGVIAVFVVIGLWAYDDYTPPPRPARTTQAATGEPVSLPALNPRVVQVLEARRGMTEVRVCVDAGLYSVVAEAENLEAAASAFLTRDGEHVAAALRYRGMPRIVRSDPVTLEGPACYTLAAQTGVNGVRAVARLEQID